MKTKNLAELYDLPPMSFDEIRTRLEAGLEQAPGSAPGPDRFSVWLSTINADGSPHLTCVGALWHDGCFWFETGEGTRKGRNVAREPRCALCVSAETFDLSVEGVAEMVTDPPTVAELAALWAAGGWPCEPDASGEALTAPFSAPSAGSPPWRVYRVRPTAYTALSTVEPGGATRWTV